MKKLTVILAMLTIASITHATDNWQFPGFGCQDTTVLQNAAQNAPNESLRLLCEILHALVQTPSADFTQFKNIITATVNASDINNKDRVIAEKIKQVAYHHRLYETELLSYCQQNPSDYDYYICMRHCLTDSWAMTKFIATVNMVHDNPQRLEQSISALISLSINDKLTDAEMKTILRRLDLLYTDKLTQDKEKWFAAVAKIRTLLERY